jgi:hypothetical protein
MTSTQTCSAGQRAKLKAEKSEKRKKVRETKQNAAASSYKQYAEK